LSSTRLLSAAVVEAAFVGLAGFALLLALPNDALTYDVLERSWLLWQWEEAPASHRYFWAHMLELPIARPFHAIFASAADPTAGLRVTECLFAGVILALVFWAARFSDASRLWALACTALCGSAFSLWELAAVGEERVMQVASLLACALVYEAVRVRSPSRLGWRWLAAGLALGVGVLVHVANAVLLPFVVLAGIAHVLAGSWRARRAAIATSACVGGILLVVMVANSLHELAVGAPESPIDGSPLESFLRTVAASSYPDLGHGRGLRLLRWIYVGAGGTVSTMPALGATVFGAALVLALAAGLRRAWGDALWRGPVVTWACLLGLWLTNAPRVEPFNPEFWLFAWCFAALGLGAFVSPEGRLRLAAPAAAVLVSVVLLIVNVKVAPSGPAHPGDPTLRAEVEAFDAAAEPDCLYFAWEGFESRAYRLLSEKATVVSMSELFGTWLWEDRYTGRRRTLDEVNESIAGGRPLYLQRPSLERLRRIGYLVDARPVAADAGLALMVITSPLAMAGE